MRDALGLRSTVGSLVASFNEAAMDMRRAFALIVEAERKVNQAFLLGEHGTQIRLTANPTGHGEDFTKPELAVARMERKAWVALVERMEFKRWVSVRRWNLIEKRLNNGQLPAITEANVIALENVFHHLAGRGSVTAGYYSAIELAIREAGTRGEAETDLFRVRYFQNGNGHLWFKDAGLLYKFNAMAGGLNLRPAPAES